MIRGIFIFSVFFLIFYKVSAGNLSKNCRIDDKYICATDSRFSDDEYIDFFYKKNQYMLNGNTKIIEIYRKHGEPSSIAERCYVLFYKYENDWIPVSISCVPNNSFIFYGFINDLKDVKVKDKKGNIKVIRAIVGSKEVEIVADPRFDNSSFMYLDSGNFSSLTTYERANFPDIDDLKQQGYTILEIIDEKKK